MNRNGNIKKRKIQPGMKLFLATLPFLVLYFLFCYLPLDGWRYAFYNYRPGYRLEDCEYVGFEHIISLFSNPVMRRETLRVLTNTLVMSMASLVSSIIPLIFAVFLNEINCKWYRKLVQTVTTIPNFISWVLVYSLATALFATESGMVSQILKELGLTEKGINILANGDHVWLIMWAFGMWKSLGWNAIIYLSGLSSIDQELYEAAAVDGAGRFQKMWYITIPGLMPTFVTLLIINIGNFLSNGMDQYYVFQNSFNKSRIEVLDLYVYNLGIGTNNISQSTAVSMLKSLVGLVLLGIANVISGKVRDEKIF